MKEYISKETVLSLEPMPVSLRKYQTNNLDDVYEQGWEDCQICLSRETTADVYEQSAWMPVSERVEGQTPLWISWTCLKCGYVRSEGWEGRIKKPDANFCECCGARIQRIYKDEG